MSKTNKNFRLSSKQNQIIDAFTMEKELPYVDMEHRMGVAYFQAAFDLHDSEVASRLRSKFGRIRAGNKTVELTPLGERYSYDELSSEWLETLKSVRDEWPTLWDFEIDLGEKVGPMSVQKPLLQRVDDIRSYYDDVSLPSSPIPHEAISRSMREWAQIPRLRLRSPHVTMDDMKLNTSSGSPFSTRRSRVKSVTLHSQIACRPMRACFNDYAQYLNDLGIKNDFDQAAFMSEKYTLGVEQLFRGSTSDRLFLAAASLGWRGQEGGPEPKDTKQRVVWEFPFSVNLAELRMYQPLIKAMQNTNLQTGLPYVPAWVGNDMVDLAITRMFDTKNSEDLVICTDFSRFDQHFNADMAECAETLLYNLFYAEAEMHIKEVFPIKYNIPLAIDYGYCLTGYHGMASGSGGTNADETLVHRTLQHEAALQSKTILNPYSQCLGDDGVLTFPGANVDQLIRVYTSHGQEMNPDKQYVSTDDCVYLRRWHHKDYRRNGMCVGVYSTLRALGRLIYTERSLYDYDHIDLALRNLSIMENLKWHPLANAFADFMMQKDKFGLGTELTEFLDNISEVAKERVSKHPDLLGYTKSQRTFGELRDTSDAGIADWWIVKYLKSKSK